MRSERTFEILEYLRESPYLTIPGIQDKMGTSFNNASNAVHKLVDLKILVEGEARKRTNKPGPGPRVYRCPALREALVR